MGWKPPMSTADLHAALLRMIADEEDAEKQRKLQHQLKRIQEEEEEEGKDGAQGGQRGGNTEQGKDGGKVVVAGVKSEEEKSEDEAEESQDGAGLSDDIFRRYRTTTTTPSASYGLGGTLGSLRGSQPMTSHAKWKRNRKPGRRALDHGERVRRHDVSVRSQVIAAPRSDSSFQVWDFSSAMDEEQPWHREDEAPHLTTGNSAAEVKLANVDGEEGRPRDSVFFQSRQRRYTGLHSSTEDSDTDGYALGQAYRRRLDALPSYTSRGITPDVYSSTNEDDEKDEPKEVSLDDLLHELADNQAFKNFENLLRQMHEQKEGSDTEASGNSTTVASSHRETAYANSGYRNAYGVPAPSCSVPSDTTVLLLPPPLVPLYPSFSPSIGYGSYAYGYQAQMQKDIDPFVIAKCKAKRNYLGRRDQVYKGLLPSVATNGALPSAGRGRGRPLEPAGRGYGLPTAGRGRGTAPASSLGYKPDVSQVESAYAQQKDANEGAAPSSGFWPLLFNVFNFGASSTSTGSSSSSANSTLRRVPSEPNFGDESEDSPYSNAEESESEPALHAKGKRGRERVYSSLASSGYAGTDVQDGGEGAGVRPLLEQYRSSQLQDDNEPEDEETPYGELSESDSYYYCDGTPYGYQCGPDALEDDGRWNLQASSNGYQNGSQPQSYRNNNKLADTESESDSQEDDEADTDTCYLHTQYCAKHLTNASSSNWESLKKDWTQEFHRIIRNMDDTNSVHDAKKRMQVAEQLQSLYTEFVSVAKAIGETIIRERSLPNHMKTIKPSDEFGGIAGGEKFCVAGIFFKFAIDNNNIYGNDGLAAKCAGHELKAASALFSCAMLVGLHSPLVVLLDWWGYRLMCYSMLPISAATLAYGSADGGNTVHSGIKELNKRIKTVARVLNLKGHWAGMTQKRFLYTCCDIEGHRGTDGHYYVVDTARLFPPEAPQQGAAPTSFLYRLLRPEFVREYERPLSSDAFSKFGEDDHQSHNQEVRDASEKLKVEVVRRFAEELESATSSPWLYTSEGFIQELHRRGINVRYIALMLDMVSSPKLRAILLSELIARAIKWDIRAAMRSKIKQEMKMISQLAAKKKRRETLSACSTDECYKCRLERIMRQLACQCFQRVFADGNVEGLWSRVLPRLNYLYPAYSQSANATVVDTFKHMSVPNILARVESLLGIRFSKSGTLASAADFATLFTEDKLVALEMRTKEAYVLPRIQADCYALLAARKKTRLGHNSSAKKNEAVCYYRMAAGLYENVIKCKANDEYSLYNWGLALFHCAELEATVDSAKLALEKFTACLEVCRHAVPPNHDLATLALKATAECYSYLASNRLGGTAKMQQQQWLFLQAENHFSAAYSILTQLATADLASLAPIPTLPTSLHPPATLQADLTTFTTGLLSSSASSVLVHERWVGGEHEDQVLHLLYNWANLRREWATVPNQVSPPKQTLLEAALALYRICLLSVERWTTTVPVKTNVSSLTKGHTEEGNSKEQEDIRAASNHVATLRQSEHQDKHAEDLKSDDDTNCPTKRVLTREEKEEQEHKRWAARVLANCGVALVELGRIQAERKKECWSEAKSKFMAAEAVDTGAGSYNLGCVAALEGNIEESRTWLEKCYSDGQGPAVELWQQDDDLASLREQTWFKSLLAGSYTCQSSA